MIYVFGCSMCNWFWPAWPEWLRVYQQPVTNYAYKGYGNNLMYWQIVDKMHDISANDHVIIMWPRNDRQMQWYDREWIDTYQCEGFFPDTKGRLWFTQNTPYTGMYRWHPDHMISLTQMIIEGFAVILQTQQILDKIGCKYTMAFSQNPWFDGRPVYKPSYSTRWNDKTNLTKQEKETAKHILELNPVQNILELIDWSKFVDAPSDIYNPSQYVGIWEYYINKKEYVIHKHESDHHPVSLAHHDWAVEKILKQDYKDMPYRSLAKEISHDAMTMTIPPFSQEDFVTEPGAETLDPKYKNILSNL